MMENAPGSHERRAEGGILIGNQVDKDQVSNPIARRMVAGFDAALMGWSRRSSRGRRAYTRRLRRGAVEQAIARTVGRRGARDGLFA